MCPAISMTVVGSDLWNANAHSALSVAYRVSAALQKHATVINLAGKVWRLDRILAKMLDDIYVSAENPPANPEPVTPERIASAVVTLSGIHSTIEGMYSRLHRYGLSNHALLGAPVSSLRAHADDILDLAESLELAMNPDIDSIFAKSLEEYRRGETFELNDIR
jgi:hypothetical protein